MSNFGYKLNDSFLTGLGLKRDRDNFKYITSRDYESSLTGLFILGPLTGNDQAIIAAGEGARLTLTTAAALHPELVATRRRGFSIDNEENEPGVNCIGFPVFLRPSATPTGAISVAAIKLRLPVETLVARAGEARDTIEQHLGSGSVARFGQGD